MDYTQTAVAVANPAGSLTVRVPLTPEGSQNSYYIADGTDKLNPGIEFVLDLDGVQHVGSISEVTTQFPAPLNSGAFAFTFSTSDGLIGSVSGSGKWVLAGRYPHAEILSSVVSVN